MLVFFSIWLFMLVLSLGIGVRHSHIYQVKGLVNFSRKGYFNYTLGLHHSSYMGYNKLTGEIYRIETLYIGLLVFTFEVDFYKVLAKGPAGMNTDPAGNHSGFTSN